MPAIRPMTRRRRSSLALDAKQASFYHLPSNLTPRAFTFAENVTPVSYVANDGDHDSDDTDEFLADHPTLPVTDILAESSRPRRVPPHKRRSLGYVPRPPNAFMLFRADFVRKKHVPGSIETNHGSLSKIIGLCWRNLPGDEKKQWEALAKVAKAEHKQRYPDYRFKPVHKKREERERDRKIKEEAKAAKLRARGQSPNQMQQQQAEVEELAREQVASLFNQGSIPPPPMMLPFHRSFTPPAPSRTLPPGLGHRRSSSVPLPEHGYGQHFGPIAIPTLPMSAPFFSRPSTPPPLLAKSLRRPIPVRAFTAPIQPPIEEVESLFPNQGYSFSTSSTTPVSGSEIDTQEHNFNFERFLSHLPYPQESSASTSNPSSISPLDLITPVSAAPSDVTPVPTTDSASQSFLWPPAQHYGYATDSVYHAGESSSDSEPSPMGYSDYDYSSADASQIDYNCQQLNGMGGVNPVSIAGLDDLDLSTTQLHLESYAAGLEACGLRQEEYDGMLHRSNITTA